MTCMPDSSKNHLGKPPECSSAWNCHWYREMQQYARDLLNHSGRKRERGREASQLMVLRIVVYFGRIQNQGAPQ